ncbi:killer toxin [Basidiobolus meristosporus CBS 931.73]|uniref:Killer toxin n=1 Tax=Basidiobolus meristosporus CBS 931.73 TaxID=1314790 RepID=A0A1Y1X0D5_9FUNG|nr:killer toxin [Basidiobolus meristosporus CBS 931.73]|eukprot:ORX79203.1 killer toxin [Basidiobolus meristosporus CBS 931.73]
MKASTITAGITAILSMVLLTQVDALGINCRGSSECATTGNSLNQLVAKVCSLPGGNIYGPGVRIATNCHILGGIAAFTQKTGSSISASKACSLLHELQNHGCNVCGSVPLGYPGDNDVNHGELTVNYVGNCS